LLLGAIVWRVIPRTDTAAGQSYLVMPFSIQRGDTSLAWLRQASVDMLSRNLAQWRDVEIVDYEHTLDLLRDASLDTAGAISLRDAVALARRAGVRSVVLGQIEQTADSLSIVVRVFDAGRGDIVRQFPVAAPLSAARDPRSLFDRLSSELLGLDTVRTPLRMNVAKSTTTSVEAYRAYLTGVRLLHAWDLRHADSAFARATRIDTTFALAFSQRAVARGWMAISSEDTLGRAFARRAAGHAEQLPARERALVLAEWDRQEGRLDRARQRYDQLLAEDSSDAQAWYGIGEIHFHAQVASPEDITRTFGSARRAFDRALANDSSFHLAYQHRIDIYSRLALRDVPWILDSDTIRFVHDTTRVRDSARVSASRARASEIAVQTALRWVDNAPAAAPAYAALADAYAAAGKYAEAIATAERAMQGRTTWSTDIPYRLATYHFGAGSTQRALTALDEATRRYGPDSLRRAGSGANWRNLVATINIAAATGSLSQLDKVLGHAIAVDSVWIDRQGRRTPRSDLAFMFRIGSRAALGVLGSRDLRNIDSAIARFEALPEPNGKATRSRHWTIPYVAFISTGESRYLEHLRRWYPNELPLTIRALAALARRDTMEATRLARRLPRSGSVMALTPDGISDPLAQARVLTELGQPRAAIATLESLTPTTLSVLDPDMRWAMYARSLLERGTLYESIGDRSKAIAAYERYIDLMRDADPELRLQVRYAQRHALALRDAPR
jgi:tetratricopeptide (TPR) repeat protein